MAPPLLRGEHPARRFLRPEEHRIQIGAEDAPPLFRRQIDGAVRMRHAGIVDQDGDGAEGPLGIVECPHHRVTIEHVGRDRNGTAARLLDARLHRREFLRAARNQRDRRAFARQHLGEAHAESARRTSDQCDAPLEVEQFCRCGHAAPGIRDVFARRFSRRKAPGPTLDFNSGPQDTRSSASSNDDPMR